MPSPFISVNGAINLLSSRQGMAQAGAFYTASNPTVGTGVVWATLATASATANGLIVVANQGAKTIYFDQLKLKQTATAPTATLSLNFEAWNETGIVTGTGNVATIVPVNVNPAVSSATGAVLQAFSAGAITIPAAASGAVRRKIDTAEIATGLTFVKDTFVLDFGQDGPSPSIPGLTAARLTTPVRMSGQMGPVIVGPNSTTWLNMWWDATATNVPSFEWAFRYIEL